MNTKNIEEVQIWSPGGQRSCTKLSLDRFYDYKFDNGLGYIDYTLTGSDGANYFSASLEIPASIIQQWGADDSIIWDHVATTLGLVII